jgi:membrane fusion protein (multidrug efflux system)
MVLRNKWIYALVFIALLLFAKWKFFPGNSSHQQAKPPQGPVRVNAALVYETEFADKVRVSGTVMPAETVVLQPEVSGKVTAILFKEGAFVTKGQLLVKLNNADLLAQRRKLTAQARHAQVELERNKQLWNARAVAQDVYDAAVLQSESIAAELEINAALLDKTEIRAPFSGKIGNRNISPGAMVAPATAIATLYQTQSLKIQFFLPTGFRHGVSENSVVEVVTPSGNTLKAIIYSMEPSSDPAVGTVAVKAQISNPQGGVMPGDFVDVVVKKVAVNNAIRIPTACLMPVLKGNRVFVIEQGKAVPRDVVTGVRNDSSVLIVSGLAKGDSLITGGLMFVKPGVPVKVMPPKPAQK